MYFVQLRIAALGFTGFAFAGFARAPGRACRGADARHPAFRDGAGGAMRLGERISAQGNRALAILAGIALMALQSLADAGAGTWLGDIMFPLASLSWAIFTVLMRKWRINASDATLFVPVDCLPALRPGVLDAFHGRPGEAFMGYRDRHRDSSRASSRSWCRCGPSRAWSTHSAGQDDHDDRRGPRPSHGGRPG
jgi:hypothetical protein